MDSGLLSKARVVTQEVNTGTVSFIYSQYLFWLVTVTFLIGLCPWLIAINILYITHNFVKSALIYYFFIIINLTFKTIVTVKM